MFATTETRTGLVEAGPDAVAQARRLSSLMRAEHLSFAATGGPGWTRYRPRERATRVYDATPTVTRYPEETSRRIWRDLRFGALDLID